MSSSIVLSAKKVKKKNNRNESERNYNVIIMNIYINRVCALNENKLFEITKTTSFDKMLFVHKICSCARVYTYFF